MSLWALLAPGPSATAEQAQAVHDSGIPLGCIGNAFQLAPHAKFIAATDGKWWRTYPEAKSRDCKRFSMHIVSGCKQVKISGIGICNSGVLGLECAKREGATRILLLGFDMRGSHFFGPYKNGLSNTSEQKRRVHLRQYAHWAKLNPKIEVVNCTENSALTCFPMARLDEYLSQTSLVA